MTPATAFLLTLCAIALAALGYSWGWLDGRRAERLRCIHKLTGHLPSPGPLRDTWLQAMLDEV